MDPDGNIDILDNIIVEIKSFKMLGTFFPISRGIILTGVALRKYLPRKEPLVIPRGWVIVRGFWGGPNQITAILKVCVILTQ